ncbi:MAG: hypothetical protein JO267_11390 [Alphaproteobacteria bacterium]|nr:hypothetical protein [Alphaproteobacteria bacterium]
MAYLAATLVHGIATAHAFAQGNKHTAATIMIMFPDLNGYEWYKIDTEEAEFGQWIEQLIDRRLTIDGFAALIRPWLR